METPEFRLPDGETADRLLRQTARGIAGAELFTLLSVRRAHLPEGRLFAAERGDGRLSVLYRAPDYTLRLEDGVFPYEGLRLLKLTRDRLPRPEGVAEMALPDLLEAAALLAGGKLTAADEDRYVFKAKCLLDGFYCGFCVREEGELVSMAAIVARNEDSALLGDVFTRPDRRGRGLAARCVAAAARCAARQNKTLWALCEEQNVPFYEKLGFEEVNDL